MSLTRYDRLLRIADRLGKVAGGSAAADAAIHVAVGWAGPTPAYTTDEAKRRANGTQVPGGMPVT